jgi:hypothetical protein
MIPGFSRINGLQACVFAGVVSVCLAERAEQRLINTWKFTQTEALSKCAAAPNCRLKTHLHDMSRHSTQAHVAKYSATCYRLVPKELQTPDHDKIHAPALDAFCHLVPAVAQAHVRRNDLPIFIVRPVCFLQIGVELRRWPNLREKAEKRVCAGFRFVSIYVCIHVCVFTMYEIDKCAQAQVISLISP